MKNDGNYSWRSMTSQDIPFACETFRAGNPQVSGENLERLGQFPPERLAAKVGIDATIDEGIPKERFEPIAYAYADRAKIADYVSGKRDPAPARAGATEDKAAMLAGEIVALIGKEPRYYQDVAGHFAEHDFQTVARALGRLHADGKLWQDPRGRLCLRDSAFAAKPPAKA